MPSLELNGVPWFLLLFPICLGSRPIDTVGAFGSPNGCCSAVGSIFHG